MNGHQKKQPSLVFSASIQLLVIVFLGSLGISFAYESERMENTHTSSVEEVRVDPAEDDKADLLRAGLSVAFEEIDEVIAEEVPQDTSKSGEGN